MAITKSTNRQYPLFARVYFTFADFNAGAVTATTVFAAMDMPAGATIVGGALAVTTVFDSTGAVTASVGIGGDAAKYLADTDLKTLGRTNFTGQFGADGETGFSTLDTIDLDVAIATDASTTGAGYLDVEYILDDRANEVQPVAPA